MVGRISGAWPQRLAAHGGVAVLVTAVGAAWLLHKGPVPVVQGMTPLAETAPYWYMLAPFPILGLLVAELLGGIAHLGLQRPTVELAGAVAVLVALSHLRLALNLPLSGHALLATYFVLRRTRCRPLPVPGRWIQLGAGGLLLAVTAYVKLLWWTDPLTLGVGAAVGALLAGIGWLVVGRT